MHRGAARILNGHVTGPSVHAGTRSSRPGSHSPPGQRADAGDARSFGHGAGRSTHGEAPHLEHAAIRREMQRAGSTLGARVWIMPAPTIVVSTRIPRQPSKEVQGEAVLAAVVKSAAG